MQSRYKYYFYVEFLDGGKWEIHFPVLFSGNVAHLMNLMGLLIFPIKLGGEGGMETVQLTLPPLVLNLMTESGSSHSVLTSFL